ncbi:Glu-tRNA(Gln) amidotransferase subunit GatE [Candidatus Micrarchaeota archaeon]|nr:Glu-tRNA(Gln) amidotransferase subunit GatE [Candidatus Micrarchaeota archaeon]
MIFMDYKSLGLKVGLEFHQRLDTHKLFCNCSSDAEEKSKMKVTRKLRPTTGEMGEVDPAAMLEFVRNKTFEYETFERSSCLVELDDEPPHAINPSAVDIALEISALLNCSVPDEIHVMRKTVIDGSNTGGFQRTMIVGNDGFIETPYGLVGVLGVFLEEEACGIVEEKDGVKTYRLDRLGVPLVEIATGIMELEPRQVQDVALRLGRLLRVTGKVKRGLGTIRQDVNISIKGGARTEAKGVQDVRILDNIIDYEVMRQTNLLDIKDEMHKRKIKKSTHDIQSFTSFFSGTKCKIIKSGLDKSLKVHGIVVHNFKGILGWELSPGRRFGTELSGVAKTFGLKGLIHTDEDLAKYGIEKEVAAIFKEHNLKENDSLVLIVGEPQQMKNALEEISKRINYALIGVPNETRRALEDGNTEFMRYLAGAHRMYPETDVPPVVITEEKMNAIRKSLPEKPEEIYEKLVKTYSLSDELADKMVTSKNLKMFFELTKTKANPTLIASTLEETLVELRRGGTDVSSLNENHFKQMFTLVADGKTAREAIPHILKKLAANPKLKATDALEGFETVNEDVLKKSLDEIVKNNKDVLSDPRKAFNVLMGEMMKKYRGKADGALIAKIVKEKTS